MWAFSPSVCGEYYPEAISTFLSPSHPLLTHVAGGAISVCGRQGTLVVDQTKFMYNHAEKGGAIHIAGAVSVSASRRWQQLDCKTREDPFGIPFFHSRS